MKKLQLLNAHLLQLQVYFTRPGGASLYARYLAKELLDQIRFTSDQVREINLTENKGSYKWDKEIPLDLELDDEQRLAVLEIIGAQPPEMLSSAADDIVFQLAESREEIKKICH